MFGSRMAMKRFAFFGGAIVLYFVAHGLLSNQEFHFGSLRSIFSGGNDVLAFLDYNGRTREEQKYLLDTPGCRLLNPELLAPSVKKHFDEKVTKCSTPAKYRLTSTKGTTLYFFPERIDPHDLISASKLPLDFKRGDRQSILRVLGQAVHCCYKSIQRVPKEDSSIRINEECTPIKQHETTILKHDVIAVRCSNALGTFYNNVHHLTQRKEGFSEEGTNGTARNRTGVGSPPRKLSVIIFGMDTVSRQNFKRINPKTHKYLVQTLKAFDFRGYNKVGVNTFPNLIPALVGIARNEMLAPNCTEKIGDSNYLLTLIGLRKRKKMNFDGCPYVWRDFEKNGYVTAYIEDSYEMSTFNYLKPGFTDPPTHHYGRPFTVAFEKHFKPLTDANKMCPQIFVDALLDYSLDFHDTYRHHPAFSLTWSNTITHGELNAGRVTDDANLKYLKTLHQRGALNTSVLVFMSDHGMNSGDFRKSLMGKYETNLPYLFMVIPEWFQKKFKKATENLKENTGKLVTPFDFHATLVDIAFSNYEDRSYIQAKESKSTRSISLFREVPEERRCSDIGFEHKYCACQTYTEVKDITPLRNIETHAKRYLNKMLEKYSKCVTIEKFEVTKAFVSTRSEGDWWNEAESTIDIQGNYFPGNASVEFTCLWKEQSTQFQIMGDISRTNRYGNQSHCIDHKEMREFCICEDYA